MKIKGLLVMPGKEVQIAKIPASIKFIKSFIGAELFKIRLNDTTMIYTNKNAKITTTKFKEKIPLKSIFAKIGAILGIDNPPLKSGSNP